MDLLDLAENPIPAGCRMEMISTSDGIRLRTARWPALPGGTKGGGAARGGEGPA